MESHATLRAHWDQLAAVFDARLHEIDLLFDAMQDGDPDARRLVERFDELVAMKWRIYDELVADR